MIKIAFSTNYIVKNGPGNVILNIINNLDHKKFEITLITLFEGDDESVINDLRNNGVNIFHCKTLTRSKCILGLDKEFQQIIDKGEFDIIHSHGFISDMLLSRLSTSAKKISTLHNNMFEDYVQTYGKVKAKIFIKMHLDALRKIDCCVGCSKSVYQVMRNYLKNVTYIRNGIKPKIAKHTVTREELNIPDDAVVFVFSGVLNYRKNVTFLIENFVKSHQKEDYLLILGDGPDKEKCSQLADDHVKMLGFQDDPAAYYNISDIYASASRSEGFSISVLEALSCGLLLFISNISAHTEIFEINDKTYLGEKFAITDKGIEFKRLFKTIEYKTNDEAKNEIKKFQMKYLSDKTMTNNYQILYNKMLGHELRNKE